MNTTPDPRYEATKARFKALTPQQQANVRQRLRSVRAIISSKIYLFAMDRAIETELAGGGAPEPCDQFLIRKTDVPPVQRECLPEQPIMAPHWKDKIV